MLAVAVLAVAVLAPAADAFASEKGSVGTAQVP